MPLATRFVAGAIGILLYFYSAPNVQAQAATCVEGATPDWMTSIQLSDSSAQVRPADCATVEQTPPDFSWPDLSRDAQYKITLIYPSGRSRSRPAPQNWVNWDEILPAGNYSWQVQVTSASGTRTSRARRFTVAANAKPFLVPDPGTVYERATSKAHPRALPDERDSFLASLATKRREGLALLLSRVDSQLNMPLQDEPASTDPKSWAPGGISEKTYNECQRALNAAFTWVATKREKYFAEALRRALNLAAWNPRGATSYANVDESAREIAWTLTLAYDWLFPRLDAKQKQLLLAPLKVRIGDMYDDLIGPRARIAIHPYDSHGNHTLTYLAVMSVVLAGDVPEAQSWLRDTLPLALHWTSPWGGEDGGFGNGTAYAQWDTGGKLIGWHILRWAAGIDMAQKAWVRNYARFIAYFMPPGIPVGTFGDGAEYPWAENWARVGKAYTLFAPSPLGRWYASQLTGEDAVRLELLLAPLADSSPAPYPAGTPNSELFPSIGWAAMHSDLSNRARVSVYFKSSFYASYNHSHADQNSFIVNAGGQRLAIDSGYYDGYKTPHWWQWYKQTRAHNAITFDGGQGQVLFEESNKLGRGVVTRFEHQPGYDIVMGDATQAYGGAFQEARRALVYLRPNLILVYDKVVSSVARQWEWNIHALNRMEVAGDRKVTIRNGGESLCVEMLASPPAAFAQNNRFSVEPQVQDVPAQWHGAFVSRERSTSAEFVALMRVGCQATKASASKMNHIWTVAVDGRATITIAPENKDPISSVRIQARSE